MKNIIGADATWTFHCGGCGFEGSQRTYTLARWSEIEWPMIPEGWNNLNDVWYCPLHAVTIEHNYSAAIAKRREIEMRIEYGA